MSSDESVSLERIVSFFIENNGRSNESGKNKDDKTTKKRKRKSKRISSWSCIETDKRVATPITLIY